MCFAMWKKIVVSRKAKFDWNEKKMEQLTKNIEKFWSFCNN